MKYRPDIDGLRTLAVVPVVLFHAGVAGLPGGFAGVDVFFVISGFLITGLLVNELETSGRISIVNFYARRARRLLPALVLVLGATLLAAHLIVPPAGERQSIAQSAIAALFFVSNVYFWRARTGYFGEDAESLPLLHTWTLAVEEQFYIVWPLLIVAVVLLAIRLGWRSRIALLASFSLVGAGSFLLALWLTGARPEASFFLVITRAWEFAAGAVLAILAGRIRASNISVAGLVALVGVIALAITFSVFDGKTSWPGWSTLLPVAGTAAIITAGILAPANPVSRVLAIAPMVYVGRISYSWYLWHWPVLALLHGQMLGDQTAIQRIAAVTLSFVAASLSYHLVETPIRQGRVGLMRGNSKALKAAAGMLVIGGLVCVASLMRSNGELEASPRLKAIHLARTEALDWPADCNHYQYPFVGLSNVERCQLGDRSASKALMVWGDSHAHHLLPMFDELGKARGFAVVGRTRGGCRPFTGGLGSVGLRRTDVLLADCARFHAVVLEQLAGLKLTGVGTVVVASRWPPGGEDQEAAVEQWLPDLQRTIDAVRAAGLQVLIVADGPAFRHSVPECLMRRDASHCGLSRADFDRQRASANAALRAVASSDSGVRLVDLADFVCGREQCDPVNEQGVVMFKDDHHLSVPGARALASGAVSEKLGLSL